MSSALLRGRKRNPARQIRDQNLVSPPQNIMPPKRIQPNNKPRNGPKPNGSRPRNALTTSVRPPTALGTVYNAGATRSVQQTRNGIRVTGVDLVTTLLGHSSGQWNLVGALELSPAYFTGTMLGEYSRLFERFKIVNLAVEYRPCLSTAVSGELMLTYLPNPYESTRATNTSAFVPGAMSAQGSVMGPIWQPLTLRPSIGAGIKFVDPAFVTDIKETTSGTVYCYSNTATAGSPGYLSIRYTLEFTEPVLSIRRAYLPFPVAWHAMSIADTTAPAVGAPVILTVTGSYGYAIGGLVKIIYKSAGSVINSDLAINTLGVNWSFPLRDGLVMWGIFSSSANLHVYLTHASALSASDTNRLTYIAAGGANAYNLMLNPIRMQASHVGS